MKKRLYILAVSLLRNWTPLYNYLRRFYLFMRALDARMRFKLFSMQGMTIINGLIYLAGSLSIIPFINYLAAPEQTLKNNYIAGLHNYITTETSFNFTIFLGLFSIIALLFARIASIGSHYLILSANKELQLYYSNKLFAYYLRQKEHENMGDSSAKIITDLTQRLRQIVQGFIDPIFRIIDDFIFIGAGIGIIFLSNPQGVTLLLLLFFLTLLSAILLTRKRMIRAGIIGDTHMQKQQAHIIEGLNIREHLQIMGKETFFINQYMHSNKVIAQANFKVNFITALFAPINEFLIYTLVVLSMLSLILLTDELVLSSFTLFLLVTYRLMPRVNNLFNIYAQMRRGVIIYDAIAESLLPALSQEISLEPHIKKPYPLRSGIQLQHISYRYPNKQGNEPLVLDDISLEIKKGQKIGICGESGSGKTTLLRILIGSISPQTGEILIDNLPINTKTRLRRWQDCLGYVSQNIFLLNNSVAANVTLLEDAANIKEKQLQQALYLAAADEFTSQLKHGAQTLLAEAGKSLSGGQRQRLIIARALYMKPRVLVLDEATSSLDKKTESLILERLWETLKNETIIFVTHRIESIRKCDKLFFLQKGRLVAQGSYSYLLKNKDFKQMVGNLEKKKK